MLQLVEKGLVKLTDAAATHVDPALRQLNGTTLHAHFGDWIDGVTIENLLHMTSGVADYDGQAYATAQFGSRGRDFDPGTILLKYVHSKPEFAPGTRQQYCSTNYILLGLVLLTHSHSAGTTHYEALRAAAPGGTVDGWDWRSYAQAGVLPSSIDWSHSRFVDRGTCESVTPVHGFMQGYDGASLPPQDVWNVSCVGGWTAGNYVGSVADVARYSDSPTRLELAGASPGRRSMGQVLPPRRAAAHARSAPHLSTARLLYGGGAIVSPTSVARMTNFSAPSQHFKFCEPPPTQNKHAALLTFCEDIEPPAAIQQKARGSRAPLRVPPVPPFRRYALRPFRRYALRPSLSTRPSPAAHRRHGHVQPRLVCRKRLGQCGRPRRRHLRLPVADDVLCRRRLRNRSRDQHRDGLAGTARRLHVPRLPRGGGRTRGLGRSALQFHRAASLHRHLQLRQRRGGASVGVSQRERRSAMQCIQRALGSPALTLAQTTDAAALIGKCWRCDVAFLTQLRTTVYCATHARDSPRSL